MEAVAVEVSSHIYGFTDVCFVRMASRRILNSFPWMPLNYFHRPSYNAVHLIEINWNRIGYGNRGGHYGGGKGDYYFTFALFKFFCAVHSRYPRLKQPNF